MTHSVNDLRFVERMGGALTDAGLPRLPSRAFAALLSDEDGRMTAAELAAALEVSPAGVSGAVNYLARVGMLRRERHRGSRRDVYVVDDDAWHTAMLRRDQLYAPMVGALDEAIADLGDDDPRRVRLVLTREFLVFVDEELADLATRWDDRRRALLRRSR
ncbi:MarR family transcriptional regulator [Nocardioides guangzhouensis]|uniref:MarR family transcriptional regulator n=1 Tax=Nocardioides guangzhouensis TaxID=2497878 RepID=A0A4Q4ZIZ5_9ACTN|nr:MarR family transcriptional regulator [Nocardioides guangzhouensis]RYP87521.1 MarR family transcriptional regulator [Nocardioides guangzhouensis]